VLRWLSLSPSCAKCFPTLFVAGEYMEKFDVTDKVVKT